MDRWTDGHLKTKKILARERCGRMDGRTDGRKKKTKDGRKLLEYSVDRKDAVHKKKILAIKDLISILE